MAMRGFWGGLQITLIASVARGYGLEVLGPHVRRQEVDKRCLENIFLRHLALVTELSGGLALGRAHERGVGVWIRKQIEYRKDFNKNGGGRGRTSSACGTCGGARRVGAVLPARLAAPSKRDRIGGAVWGLQFGLLPLLRCRYSSCSGRFLFVVFTAQLRRLFQFGRRRASSQQQTCQQQGLPAPYRGSWGIRRQLHPAIGSRASGLGAGHRGRAPPVAYCLLPSRRTCFF
jgi:hypothetical protein